MKTLGNIIAVLLSSATFAPVVHATVHDHLFANGFDIPTDAPASTNDAARFLTQATFGPTAADISRLMTIGYREWIDEQLGMPTTLSEPVVEAVVTARSAALQNVGQSQRLNRWFWQATYAPDQLRQRMAFALSQIFVISDASSALNQFYVEMSNYQDMLARDAFGLYRNTLQDVTWHPMMGHYLNAFHNLKPSTTTSPDENYAREVMQLFSIGLIVRNIDFSPALLLGQTIPTYDQTVITHTAKVFTGFTWSDAPLGSGAPNYTGVNFYGGGLTYAARYAPMACWGIELAPPLWYDPTHNHDQTRHDLTGDNGTIGSGDPKVVLLNQQIPSGQSCAQDVSDELDIIAAHQNVAPFIARQLIQRFVTSNPSPAYILRVATVFENSTGDLGDVVKAILTDTEARTPPVLANGDSYGKLREPILRLTAMWRAFSAKAPAADTYGEIKMIGNGGFQSNFGQAPLESPTVFNFYLPDYQQPGTFANNNLYSPELQITNESTTYTTANSYYNFTANGYIGVPNYQNDRPLIDLSSLTANTSNTLAMVATINANMLYGSMSAKMQTTLNTLLGNLGNGGTLPQEMAWSAIYVTLLSPEYAVQR